MNTAKKHSWVNFRYLEQNGKNKKMARENPTRQRLTIRKALRFLNKRWHEVVPFCNPDFHGYKYNMPHAIQWLDFVLLVNKKLAVILTQPPLNKKGFEQAQAKIQYMTRRHIPYLILNKRHTYMEDVVFISRWIDSIRKGTYVPNTNLKPK